VESHVSPCGALYIYVYMYIYIYIYIYLSKLPTTKGFEKLRGITCVAVRCVYYIYMYVYICMHISICLFFFREQAAHDERVRETLRNHLRRREVRILYNDDCLPPIYGCIYIYIFIFMYVCRCR